ncbi:Ig-like domain-containing protein [Cronobacter sakazakii]|nr:Ig-like domain-containing protein [Cronobacter sakazakii]ELY4765293.1 Ig-like domain-containing protein [Cronobacter sakazakii]
MDRTVPSVSIAILSTDDYLNAAEATQPLEIRGFTTVTGPGAQVTVTFNDKTYTAVLDSAGNWSVLIPPADLATLPDGPRTVTATVTSGSTTATTDRVINVEINDLPAPTIVTPFGDGALSAADLQQNQTLSGNTGVSGSGQTVTVQIGNQTYTTTAGTDGGWSVTIPASQLQALPPGQTPIVVTATDGAGNSASATSSVNIDTTPPALSLYAVTDDGKLNAQELTTSQVLSGNSSEAGQTVTVTLNGKTYTTTTGSDGNWQVTLPAADLGNLSPGANPIVVTTTDAAGNTAQITDSLNVKTALPSVTVTPFTGDNALDAAEIKTAQPLQGSVTNAEPGSVVTVAIGAWNTTATVDAAGNWRVDVPAVVLQGLANGDNNIQVSVTDTWNQTTTIQAPITVDTAASGVAISIIADDDFINRTEADSPLTIRGTSAGLPANTEITVTLNGITYTATVDANGNWQTTVPAADLQGLADGNYEVTATAQQGGVSDSHTLTVIINNLPDTTIDPLFTDGTLSQAEAGVDQVLTGSTGVAGAGQSVTVTLNGQAYQGTVDANGNWSVTLPSGALDSLTGNDSPVPLQIVVRDAAGNSQTTTTDFIVDVDAPTLTINPFAQDDALNITEAGQAQAFSGVATGAAQGDAIVVTLNGKTYNTTVTGANGEWSVNIPAADLQALPNGQAQFSVTVTDAAGNTSTATKPITVAVDPARAPLLTIDPVGGDGVIDAGERASGVTLSGTATNVTAGQTVTITLGNDTFTGVVDSAGRWEVNLPADALAGLANGAYTVTAVVSDAAGNSVSLDRGFSVNTDISALTVSPVTGDNRVSLDDIAGGLVLSGSSVNFAPQTTLTITLNGKQYTATTGADGSWSVTVPRADALDISDGKATLTVSGTDENGAVISGSQSFTIITTDLPEVTLNTPFTDGIISAAEVSAGGALSGTTGVTGAGQSVTVQLGGNTYNAMVDSSGNWSVTLPPSALQGLTEGTTPLVVTATDAVGNQNTSQSTVTVDLTAPVLTVNDITADNIVNATEAAQPLTISGSATPYDPQNPQTVVVQIGGQSYSALVQSDGTWSVTLPAGALTTLPDGPVSVTATVSDAAGNTSSEKVSLTLDASQANAPLVAVNTVAADNFINATEAQSPLQITGTTTRVEPGQTVTVTLNGQTYTGEVQPNGTWSVTVPATALAQVADGQQTIGVTVTDASGNQAFVQYPVTFAAQPGSQPQVTLNAIAGDDIINSQESGQPLDITGTSTNLAPGTIVSVVFNNVTYTGTTGANGQWSVTVPASALAGLQDGAYTVTATARDAAQNTATDSSSVTVDTTAPATDINGGSFLDDAILNVSESLTDQTLGGTTTAGATVQLVVGTQTLTTVAGADGTWSITIPAAQLQALDNGPQDLTLTGTTGVTGDNQYVTVTIDVNGTTYVANVDSAGNWSLPLPAGALSGLSPGQHTLTIVAQDNFGNSQSIDVPFQAALTPPQVALTQPLFGDGYVNIAEAGAASTISGTLTSDLPAGSQISVTIGNQTFGPDRVTVNDDNTWTLSLTAADWTSVPNGLQSVNVSLTDGAGNTATTTAPLYVSLAAPTLTIDAPFGGDGLSGAESQQTQTITGTVTNVEPGQTITVTLGGKTFTTTVQNGNTWSLQLSPAQLATLANGPEQITATVTDKAGNVASAPAVNVDIDTTPPAVAVAINPVAGDNIINAGELGDAVTISGTTLGGVSQVTVQINGTAVGTATVQPDGSWSLDVPATQFPNQGNYTIVATTDGGTPATTNVTVTLDTVPPVVTVGTIAGDNVIDASEASQPLVLNGTASTSEAGRQVTVTFNGETYYAVVGADGAWSVTVPQSALNGLSDGTYPVTATLTDAAGNVDTDTRNITLDTTGPLLTVDAAGVPAVLNTVNAAGGLLLQGTGEPGQTVTLRLGPLTETATVDQNGNWKYTFPQLDLTTLTDGAQVINISSTDAQGNTSTNNVALNVALNKGFGVLVDDLFGGDGILNVAESLVTQTLTGQLSGDYRGATVTATLVGTDVNLPLNALVGGDGRISVDFPPSLWQGIVDNTLQVQLNVTDAFGNVTNKIIDINLALTDVPVVSQVLVGTDNLINFAESTVNQTISGVVSNAENVSSIIVNFAGQRLTAVVDDTGRWTATLPSTLLGALPDGQAALQVVVTDNAGNVNTTGATFNVAINNLPTINIGSLFGDGTLSIPELLQGTLSGTTTGLAGQTLTIQIGSTPAFTATVGPNGVWSVNLPEAVQSALTGIATGNQTVTVTASDVNGNSASATGSLTLDLLAPALSSLSVFGDGLLNAADALVSQTISGVVTNATAGSSVSVALGARTFTGTVGTGGRFTIQLNPTDLASLAEGSLTPRVTITTPDGNTTTVNGTPVVVGITTLPTVAINTLFGGDGWLNAAEANAGQVISGTSNLTSGTVTLNVGGSTFTAAISNGAWSVNVPSATLKGLQDGTLTVSASVTDPVGNVATGSQIVNAIVQALPQVAVNPIFGDGILSLSDLLSPQLISGTATNLAAGSALTVKLGALTFNTTVHADGTWQVSVPTTSLQGLTDGPLNVTVTARDAAGNTASGSNGLTVNIGALPTLAITSLFGDNGLNATDILSAQTISGTSTNAVGSQVTVSLGGKNYVTTVGNDGTWQLSVPKTDLSGLLDGTLTVNASVTNPAGNSANTSGVLNVITHSLPTVSLTSLFGNDGYLNVSEAGSGQTISGKITGAADGATVKVTLGTNTYNATVASDGTWSLPVSSSILDGLSNGALKVGVSVTDKVGNVNSTSSDVTVKLTTPTLTFNPLTSLNPLALLSTGLTLRGGSANLAPGSVVHLSLLNGTVNTTAITDSNGNWSANLGLGLNILQLLSLSSVLNIYATDVAGNTGYLNVGLGGQIISTTPPATFAAASVEHEASLFALADETSQTATTADSQQSAVTAKIAAVGAITETNNEGGTTPADDSSNVTGGYTIGGVSIDLADGTSQSGESVQGSSGSDTIHLASLGFASLDGGAGTDTLVIDGVNLKLDLTALSGQVQHIEIFDLGKSGTNSLTLDLHQALTITDKPEDDLIVKGVNGDQVNLVKGGSDIWEVSGQREVDGVQFDVWHNSSQTNTLGDVLIQHGLHVNMV